MTSPMNSLNHENTAAVVLYNINDNNLFDVQTLLNCRLVNQTFRSCIDAMLDPKGELHQTQKSYELSLKVFERNKAICFLKLHRCIEKDENRVANLAHGWISRNISPIVISLFEDVTNWKLPDFTNAVNYRQNFLQQLDSDRNTAELTLTQTKADFEPIINFIKNSFIDTNFYEIANLNTVAHNFVYTSNADFKMLCEAATNARRAQIILHNLFTKCVSLKRVHDLFGGRKGFERLPIIDISHMQVGSYIDNIPQTALKFPIMRGIDPHGRIFFVIRSKWTTHQIPVSQVFFERYTEQGSWSDAGHHIVDVNGYIIDEGHPRSKPKKIWRPDKGDFIMEGTFVQLANLIKNGRNEKYVIE